MEASPSLTPDQIEFRMKTTGKGVTDPANGRTTPRIDALNAITPVDTDADGMPDNYENWHACLNALTADASTDPDADGIVTSTEFAAGLDPCAPDTDGDGCADSEELGVAPLQGGDRDPLNPWDVFDVPAPALSSSNAGGTRNKAVSIQDVLAILFYIGTTEGSPPNSNGANYTSDINLNMIADGAEYDRSPAPNPAKPWRSGPPNKVVNIGDAIIALNQVGTNCSPPP